MGAMVVRGTALGAWLLIGFACLFEKLSPLELWERRVCTSGWTQASEKNVELS
jgi:hypothetical protein